MTEKQEWYLKKLLKEVEEMDPEKYGIEWQMQNLAYADGGFNYYQTSKSEASHDIETLLNVLKH